jgi:hypothetical protein
LPFGIHEGTGNAVWPLGLGQMVNDKTAAPKTVVFGTTNELVHLEPGIAFDANAKIVVRFDQTVKGLSGSLFLNGTLEDVAEGGAR